MERPAAWTEARRQLAEEAKTAAAAPSNGTPVPLPSSTWSKRPPCTAQDAVRWALEHVDVRVKPKDAPSGAAWSLLLLGRDDRGALVALWGKACLGRGPVKDD
jgi:hypothetical protein